MHALMGILVLLSSGIVWSTQLDEQPGAQFQAEPGDDATEPQIQQVYELMELETARAVEHARYAADTPGGLRTHNDISKQTHHHPDRPAQLKLVAIYGIGKKLAAQVVADTQPYLYRHGQTLPVGIPDDSTDPQVYKLRGISNSCVVLERDQQAQTLCLHPDFRVDSAGGHP